MNCQKLRILSDGVMNCGRQKSYDVHHVMFAFAEDTDKLDQLRLKAFGKNSTDCAIRCLAGTLTFKKEPVFQ